MKLKFTMLESSKLILVEMRFYTKDVLPMEMLMILDTGCKTTLLNRQDAEKLGFVPNRRNKTKNGIETASGENMPSYKFTPAFLQAFGFIYDNFKVEVCDFGYLLESSGFLGLDFFKDKILTIDIENKTLEVT
jgi:predicted aspartyl protease